MPSVASGARLIILGLIAGCHGADRESALKQPVTVDSSRVASVGGGNALTLPAQRHLVRLAVAGPPVWLLAVQQDGADGHGLGWFRSDDDARSFHYYQPIQDDASERDTADLLAIGSDVALVYSFEGPTLIGDDRHDVYFQWWRGSGGDWSPGSAVRVFAAQSSSSAYYRAEIARDSLGRLWVQAFRLNDDGSATARIAVSTDGGQSFAVQPDLGTFPTRGGGRLLSLGARLVFVWDGHDAASPTRFRTRDDGAALGSWGPTEIAFDEGIYHGAACSAVADGGGGMHLVYKDKNMVLRYRFFDGSAFGPSQIVESQGDWELQAAVTRAGDDLWIFYNRVIQSNVDDEVWVRKLSAGQLYEPTALDSSASFKGYPAAVDVLPAGASSLPCFFAVTPTADDGGALELYAVAIGNGGGFVDAGAPPNDLAPAAASDSGSGSSSSFALEVTFTDTGHVIQAVDPSGTAYATALGDGSETLLYASGDGRTWSLRGAHDAGGFAIMTSLASGTLLADTQEPSGHVIARSTDQGATWTDVLPLGDYRTLTPHSFAELDGVAYVLEYQSFTEGATPIALHASVDGGATWSQRFVFDGHRHGHGLAADASTHTLWAYFGDTDPQCGVYRSTDGGVSFQLVLGNQDGDVVDATPLPGGGLLFGQDISYLPTRPSVAQLDGAGNYTILAPLIGPSYAIHALSQGGFVVSSERENGGDIYPDGEVSAHLYGSPDGVTWTRLYDYPWLDANADYVRADVYWELPSRELVLTLYNADGFGPNGRGYQLLRRQ